MHLQMHVELDRTTGPLGRALKKFIERISGKGRIEEELENIWSTELAGPRETQARVNEWWVLLPTPIMPPSRSRPGSFCTYPPRWS